MLSGPDSKEFKELVHDLKGTDTEEELLKSGQLEEAEAKIERKTLELTKFEKMFKPQHAKEREPEKQEGKDDSDSLERTSSSKP